MEKQEQENQEVDESWYSVVIVVRIVVTLVAVFLALSQRIHPRSFNRFIWVLVALVLPELYILTLGVSEVV